jgi:hypothetical protein
MKFVVVGIGDGDGGLEMEAGAEDVLDGNSRRSGRPGKFEGAFDNQVESTLTKRAFLDEITGARSWLPPLQPITMRSKVSCRRLLGRSRTCLPRDTAFSADER